MIIDLDLVRKLEASAVRFGVLQTESLQSMNVTGNPHLLPIDEGALIALGRGRFVNRGIGLGLGGTPPGDLLDRLEAFFADAGLTAALEVCPWVPQTLVDELARRGYQVDCFLDVFVHDLRNLAVLPVDPTPGPFGFIEVDSDNLAAEWARIHASDTEPGSPEQLTSTEFCAAIHRIPASTALLAEHNGERIATGSYTAIGPVAWFGGAVTVPARRGEGAQQALLAERLRRAASTGCEVAAITADPWGVSARNIRRTGFQLAYTQVRMSKR